MVDSLVGRAAPGEMFLQAVILSVVSAAVLVAAMGNRAMFWRQFIERKEEEVEDDSYDEDITGPWSRRQKDD